MSRTKGKAGVPYASAFIAAFPLHPDPQKNKVVTIQQFDAWAVGLKFIPDPVEHDTRNTDRNVLRNKINNAAAGSVWIKQGNEPFHIAVRGHGKDYRIQRTNNAFTTKARQLPAQLKSIVQTKREKLNTLLSSVDLDSLPMAMQLQASQLDQEIVCLTETVTLATDQVDRKFHAISGAIAQMVKTGKLVAGNGITAMITNGDGSSEP
jgi:hypothetical protein